MILTVGVDSLLSLWTEVVDFGSPLGPVTRDRCDYALYLISRLDTLNSHQA